MGGRVAWFAAVLLLSQTAPSAQDSRPLPDPDAFSRAVRANLARADQEQGRFAYKERRTEVHTNPFGRIGTGDTVVSDVVPSADGTELTRRVIERAGKAVTDSPIERRTIRPRRAPRPYVDDVYATLAFTIERREMRNGRRIIVIGFTPRPDAKPQTRQGRIARSFQGTIWVDEDAHEVERVEAKTIEALSFGYGMLARLSEGTRVVVIRTPVASGLWMPISVRFTGEGRAMLFRKLRLDFAIDWFDYRRIEER